MIGTIAEKAIHRARANFCDKKGFKVIYCVTVCYVAGYCSRVLRVIQMLKAIEGRWIRSKKR